MNEGGRRPTEFTPCPPPETPRGVTGAREYTHGGRGKERIPMNLMMNHYPLEENAVSSPPISSLPGTLPGVIPSPEVVERPRRRRYTAEYKRRILEEVDAAAGYGAIGAILRREGLYASTIASWRRQRERGLNEALQSKKRGPKSTRSHPLQKRLDELERENRRLQKRLKHAEILLDIQKKISEITGIPLKGLENGDDD